MNQLKMVWRRDSGHRFKRYGRFCEKCEEYFRGYSKSQHICVACMSPRQQSRYFNRMPKGLELEGKEIEVYKIICKRKTALKTNNNNDLSFEKESSTGIIS